MKQKVLVIVGPTTSGKSDLAVRLALRLRSGQAKNGCEVISADSRQVYKGLNIGSGKITKPETQGVKHYLLDVADPKKQFSASDYKKLAEERLQYINTLKKLPIVVGGTGFYIDTLTGAVNLPDVPPNKKLRAKLEKLSTDKLFKMLRKKDPKRALTIDTHNRVRIIRALEIVEVLGKVPDLNHYKLPTTNYKLLWIGIRPDNLDERIKIRLKKRWSGIVREVKRLHNQGLTWKRMYELGLEYRYVSLFVRGQLTREEACEKLFTEIRRYAKRQMTYWKKNRKIKWFTLSKVVGFKPSEYKKIESYVRSVLG